MNLEICSWHIVVGLVLKEWIMGSCGEAMSGFFFIHSLLKFLIQIESYRVIPTVVLYFHYQYNQNRWNVFIPKVAW